MTSKQKPTSYAAGESSTSSKRKHEEYGSGDFEVAKNCKVEGDLEVMSSSMLQNLLDKSDESISLQTEEVDSACPIETPVIEEPDGECLTERPPVILYSDGDICKPVECNPGNPVLGKLYIDQNNFKFFQTDYIMEQVLRELTEPAVLTVYANDSLPSRFQGSAFVVIRLGTEEERANAFERLKHDGNGGWKQSRYHTLPLKIPESEGRFFLRAYYRNETSKKFKKVVSYFVSDKDSRSAEGNFAVVSYYWSDGAVPSAFPVKKQRHDMPKGAKMMETPEPENGIIEGEASSDAFGFSSHPTLEAIRTCHDNFVAERGWNQFHTPRNLLLALVGEVGEVAELFQWKGESQEGLPDWTPKEKQNLGEELADVLIYLVRLADKCNVDLPKVTERKMQLNALKYPADLVYGSSKKYTEYKESKKKDENGHP